MCESLPYYECETCGSDQYIWYHPSDQRWHIGSGGCGSASAEIRVDDPDQDLEAVSAGSWEEWDGSTFGSSPVSVTVTIGSSYTKVDTEECMCPVDGVEVGILRGNGNDEPVTVNDGKFATAVLEGEVVTLYLKSYYGVEGSSDCTDPTNGTPLQHEGHNLRCIDFTDTHGVTQLADVLEVASGSAVDGICQCPDGYEIWDPQSYEHAKEIYEKVGSDFQWTTPTDQNFAYAPNAQCNNYLCSHVSHKFSVSDDTDDKATVQHGAWPRFKYTATEDAEVHFLDTSTQSLSARLVHGAAPQPASYVNGLPIVAAVDRCGWEIPAWTLQGVAYFELGATNFSVRVLEADEVDEAKYYYPYGDLSNTDHGLEVRDCNATERADMVNASNDIMLRGCRAKIPEVRECGEGETPANKKCQTERLPCATMDHTYVDELPVTRNFARDLSDLANAAASVDFEIISPLCLDSVMVTGTKLQQLIDPPGNGGSREDKYALAGDEKLLLLSELPEPQEEGLYGTACSPQTGAVFREGDAVELEFKLVEREPDCLTDDDLYPWDDCSKYKNIDPLPAHDSLPTDRQIKLRVADGVSGIEDSDEYAGTATFKHIMTVGEPNPFAPFSHELSVEFSRAFDAAKILFVRHVLVLGSIPEEVPQVWTVATNPTLIFSIIRDPPGGASTATLVEGSTISTSMAIDGSHAAQLEDERKFGVSGGGAANVKAGLGIGGFIQKGVLDWGFKAGFGWAWTPVDVSVSRSTSRHFDIGISFSTAVSTSDSPYLAGQPSDVIIGGGANLRFISAIEIYAKETPNSNPKELCLGGLTADQFLPEQVSTWVMSVYEIEKTIERIGAALTDPNTKMENKDSSSNYDPRADLVKQIENWRTVLANYRAATVKDQAESVAAQLERELNSIHANFQSFLKDTTTGVNHKIYGMARSTTAYGDFLRHGLGKLAEWKLIYHGNFENLGVPEFDGASKEADKETEVCG
jgi:hypothetical protein